MMPMRRIGTDRIRTAKICLIFVSCSFILFILANTDRLIFNPAAAENACIRCHGQSTGRAGEVVALHRASIHGKVGLGCEDCHGGDAAQTEKAKAHSGDFVAKPDAVAILSMCGACHQPQLEQFRKSRHFVERKGSARLDCAECHGVHSIGNLPESFSYRQLCASCHGLEYLPALPQPFQDLLTLSDELKEGFKSLSAKGVVPTEEMNDLRKEIRGKTAGIVHQTDRVGGLEKIPEILPLGEKLRIEIAKHAKAGEKR